LVRGHEGDRVETLFGIDELRLKAREIDNCEPVARFGIERPAIDLEVVLTEVSVDVLRRVDPREVDPRLVARVGTVTTFDEDADLWECEEISTGDHIGPNDRKTERPERRDDDVLFGAGGKVDDEGVGFASEFDLEVSGGGGGLRWSLVRRFVDVRVDDRGSGGISRGRNGAR
jgi:hypothetical protein